MRTFSRDDWNAAQAAWADGQFSPEWKAVRHQAALRGMIYPPTGSPYDSWADAEPSQRAMLIRSIRETPELLAVAVSRCHSWGEVIAYVLRRRDDIRDELDERKRERERMRREERGLLRQTMVSVKSVLSTIVDS